MSDRTAGVLAALRAGDVVELAAMVDYHIEESVSFRREATDRFRVSRQLIFHDGSCTASSPLEEILDEAGVRERVAALLARGFGIHRRTPPAR